jgi:hypothetical protein
MEPATQAKIQSGLSLVLALLFSIGTLAAIYYFLVVTFSSGEFNWADARDHQLYPVLYKCFGIFFPLTVLGAFAVARGWQGPPLILAVVAGIPYYYLGLFTYLRGGMLLLGLMTSVFYYMGSLRAEGMRLRATACNEPQEPANL